MPELTSDSLLTTQNVADMVGVAAKSVINWIESGQLKAAKTPGGHRRITPSAVLDFVRTRGLPIPKELRRLARPRILIVDDDERLLRSMKAVLTRRRRGLEFHTAKNGVEALVKVGKLDPAIILLDIVMPEMDGFEVCRQLRANPDTAGIKIIAITGDKVIKEEEVLAVGADGLLYKPVDLDDLLARCEALVANE